MDRDNLILGVILGLFLALPLLRILFKPSPTSRRFFTTQAPTTTYYENVEEWEIVRNKKTGRTEGVRVTRTAKEA